MNTYGVLVKDEVTGETVFAKNMKSKSKAEVLLFLADKLGEKLETKGIEIKISQAY